MERRQLNLALLLQALSTQAGAEGLTEDSWLTDEDLVTCVHADGSLCVGYKRTLLCVHDRDGSDAGLVGTEPPRLADGPALTWTYSSADAAQATSSVQAVPEGEAITTATWLHIPSNERPGSPPVFRGAQSPTLAVDVTRKVVLLGTSSGHVQLHDARGHLLHRQLLHEQPVLGVQVAPTPPGAIAAMPGQHAHTVVVSQRGALCSICTCAIGAVLRHVIAHAGAAAVAIPLQRVVFGFTKWLMPRGTCARSDGACVPAAPHLWRDALCAFTRGGVADGAAASFISVGQGPAVTLFEAVDAEGAPAPDPPGLEALGDGGGALDVKSMAKGLAGAVLGPAATAATDLLGIHAPGCRTLAADTVNAIIDDRIVETLVPSPSGQLAACTDDKGRVMLLDTANLCFLRAWKGYRDAQCAWIQVPPMHTATSADETLWRSASPSAGGSEETAAACSKADPSVSPQAPTQRTHSQDGGSPSRCQRQANTYLLIYAPRREVLEVWPPRSGRCVRTFKCGSNCALMAPPHTVPAAQHGQGVELTDAQDCFVLNGTTGELFSMRARLLSS